MQKAMPSVTRKRARNLDAVRFASVFFLQALVSLTVRAVEELPSWAIKVFNEKLIARYELVQKMEPSFFTGDFNGDGRSDVALLIKERTTGKVGIAILESGKNQFKILGAGRSFGNGGDDFRWIPPFLPK